MSAPAPDRSRWQRLKMVVGAGAARAFPFAPVVACSLTSAGLGNQLDNWRVLWADAGIERVLTDDGISLRFRNDPEVESRLRGLVTVENECCRWATWEASVDDGALLMRARSSGAGTIALHQVFESSWASR